MMKREGAIETGFLMVSLVMCLIALIALVKSVRWVIGVERRIQTLERQSLDQENRIIVLEWRVVRQSRVTNATGE